MSITNGETNTAVDVNNRWGYSNGTVNTTHTDTTSWNLKTSPYVDSAGASIGNTTYEYVSIYSISAMNATLDVEYWAESSDANNPTYQTTITYIKEGTGSGSFSWTNSAGTAIWTNTQNYGDLSAFASGYFAVWCYITAACYAALDTNGIRIRTGSDTNNYDEFYFAKADLVEGWNYLECDLGSPDATEGTPDYSGTDYLRITVYETASSTIYFDDFKIYDYADSAINGCTYFQLGRLTIETEGKTIIQTIRFGGDNFAGEHITGGF